MSALENTKRQGSRLIWPDKPSPAGSQRNACDPAAAMRRDSSTHSRAGPTCKSLAVTKNNTVFAGAGLRRRGSVRMANRPFGSIRSMLSTTSTPSGPSAGIVTVVRYWGTARWVRVGTFPSIHSVIGSTAVKGIGSKYPVGRAHSGRPPVMIESTPSAAARAVTRLSVSAGRPTRRTFSTPWAPTGSAPIRSAANSAAAWSLNRPPMIVTSPGIGASSPTDNRNSAVCSRR